VALKIANLHDGGPSTTAQISAVSRARNAIYRLVGGS
jgi:hypothetical protein